MYQRGNLSQNMNPAQRLEILKKEMEHLAVEKEILQAQTRNLEMEKEVCKLRQGILALQSNTGVSTSETTASKASTSDEIVVTPRRIVKKSANKSPIQPAFSPPRFIRRYEEPEEERPPILTPAARMVQASLDLNKSQTKPLKASTFMERKQAKREAEESVQPVSTPPFRLNDSSPECSHPVKRQRRSNLERFNDDDEFDSIDSHANKLSDQRQSSPSKPAKMDNKRESVKSEVLTPTARMIKVEMEKKQAEKEATEKAKQDALKAKKMAKEVEKKIADPDVSFSLQRPHLKKKIDKAIASTTIVEQSIHKKQTEDEVILTPAAKKVQADLDSKKTVIHRTENIVVTETRKQVVVSPKIISENKSDNSSSDSESKLTPTARAVKELMESKLQAQKKPSPKPVSPTIRKPVSPVSLTVSKPVTPVLPDTPKSRGVHFAKVEKVHLNKPYVPDKVMTPEKVKGIIKPPRLARRPLHPEQVQLKPRKSTRGNVCFSQTTVEDAEDSIEEEEKDQSVPNSQTSSTNGNMRAQTSSSGIKSRGRKRQIETDSSNDDFSEIEESAVTPQPTKRRRTYVTTPHPVKGRRRSKVAAVSVNDEDDYADVSDTSDAVSDQPSPKRDTKPEPKRGRKKKAAVIEAIEDEVPVEKDNSQDKEEDQMEKEEIQVEKEPVPKKTTKSKTTQLKQTKKGKGGSKNGESNEESEKNEEIVMSTPTKKRRSAIVSKKITVSETENKSEDVKSTPTKRRRSSLTTSSKITSRVSEDNDESEDSTIGTPSKRRRSILPKSSKASSSKMADIPEDKSVLTPVQREIMAKMNPKASKGKKTEDSEDSSPEKTATTVKKAGGSKGKEEKKVEDKPNLTPTARLVLAKMQQKENSKKTKGIASSDVNTDSDASDASKKKSKRK
ncbi:hypothetical protein LOTGIDRAFT_230355 [Lottia gigantea]|uniref:Uncharacterized protein n=1 Tax=Lottia gigantea TaxID=225164 RepID=V4BA92_LOTGI|nr:hypothetical protein LOTGIDRAFT_230355 [Lottia gigantea]ESP02842.1 hypothetical protein LOTGIDRAFT_230355 [Lottia gigantea]